MNKTCECGCGSETSLVKRSGRGYIKGDHRRYIAGHHPHGFKKGHKYARQMRPGGYKEIGDKKVHRIRAEKALGRPLPRRADVHHADGSKNEYAPLVICEDRGYHMLLHFRMRLIARGANPNTQFWCATCLKAKDHALFNKGCPTRCRQCEHDRSMRRRRPGAKPRTVLRSDCGPLG